MKSYKTLQTGAAFLVGLVFGFGLVISGMTRPEKVIGFLDILGGWDPSLILVMGAALPVHFLSYRWIRGRNSPLFDAVWHYPTSREVNKNLVIGSAMFGMGWGLGGFCPGPAITAAASFNSTVLIFVGAMSVGMLAHQFSSTVTERVAKRKLARES